MMLGKKKKKKEVHSIMHLWYNSFQEIVLLVIFLSHENYYSYGKGHEPRKLITAKFPTLNILVQNIHNL